MTLRLRRHEFADDARLVMAELNPTDGPMGHRATDDPRTRLGRLAGSGADVVVLRATPDLDDDRAGLLDLVSHAQEAHPHLAVAVDAASADLADAALAAGADIVCDIAGAADPELVDAVAGHGAALIVRHTAGADPAVAPFRIEYADVTRTVIEETTAAARRAVAAGVARDSVLIDPGHDIGKNTFHSLDLTRRLEEVVATGWPVVVSLAGGHFVAESLGVPRDQQLAGELAATAWCALAGARVFRVGDVVASAHAIEMTRILAGERAPVRAIRGLV